jgi:hypothetical protein
VVHLAGSICPRRQLQLGPGTGRREAANRPCRAPLGSTGLDWTGLDWTGLDWTGLDWTGLDWTGLDQDANGRWRANEPGHDPIRLPVPSYPSAVQCSGAVQWCSAVVQCSAVQCSAVQCSGALPSVCRSLYGRFFSPGSGRRPDRSGRLAVCVEGGPLGGSLGSHLGGS